MLEGRLLVEVLKFPYTMPCTTYHIPYTLYITYYVPYWGTIVYAYIPYTTYNVLYILYPIPNMHISMYIETYTIYSASKITYTLYMCIYICTYTYIYIHIYIYVYLNLFTYLFIFIPHKGPWFLRCIATFMSQLGLADAQSLGT